MPILVAPTPTHAQVTWHVDATACPAAGTGSVADPFCRIQDAVDAAGYGDEVLVRPGEYVENVSNFTTPITLRSSAGAAQTIITASIQDSVLLVRDQPAPYTTVDGFTLRGGEAFIGGGVVFTHTRPTMRNCIIRDNAAFRGGGVFNFGSFVHLENCLIMNNVADDEGGGVFDDHGFITAVNCTIAGNEATGSFGGVRAKGSTSLLNCILWDNRDSTGQGELAQTSCGMVDCVTAYSCVQNIGSLAGNGNIGANPLFVDAVEADFRLQSGSPCIDAGDNNQVTVTTDLDGSLRRLDDPSTTDTGLGTPPLVDMGAYEFGDDCNGNGTADADDISLGTSDDCNSNDVPDECEPDCNANDQADACDISLGESDDCTANGVPDECEPDCNLNQVADSCDLNAQTSNDCNANGIPDECDIDSGSSSDIDVSGVPDECEQPVVAVMGSRYVHVAPAAGDVPVAMYLTSPDYPCLQKYLDSDGIIVDVPVYLPPTSWPHLDLRGPALLPGTRYQIGIESDSGHRFPPVSLAMWGFGNVADSDGIPSYVDIYAVIAVYKGNLANGGVHRADLHPCMPNGSVNFVDINVAVGAFTGGNYLTLCAAPCVAN